MKDIVDTDQVKAAGLGSALEWALWHKSWSVDQLSCSILPLVSET